MTIYDEENHTPLCYYLMLTFAAVFSAAIWAAAFYLVRAAFRAWL